MNSMRGLPGLTMPTGKGGSFKPLVNKSDEIPRLGRILEGADEALGTAIKAGLQGGLGILLSPTSDGNAISITVYDGDERSRSYAANADEMAEAMGAVADLGESKLVVPTAPATKRPR